jgi:hypothetical protein
MVILPPLIFPGYWYPVKYQMEKHNFALLLIIEGATWKATQLYNTAEVNLQQGIFLF